MSRPTTDWPMTEYSIRFGTPAAAASAWNCSRVHPMAAYGMIARGAVWGTFSPVAGAHHSSPYVGPRPGEIGFPSQGGASCAPAGGDTTAADPTRESAVGSTVGVLSRR